MRKKRQKHFKEKYYKTNHPKLKNIHQQDILRCFARDYPAGKTAKLTGLDIRTISSYYQWMRNIVATNYKSFLRFRDYDINYELSVFISHSAIATMYWLDTDNYKEWDSHSALFGGKEDYQEKTTAELMSLKLHNEKDAQRYYDHYDRNYIWLSESFIKYRTKKFRTSMLDDPIHANENTYRFLIAIHVLLHSPIDQDIASMVRGRFIGEEDSMEKIGVINIDSIFRDLFFNRYNKKVESIIFSDLMEWCTNNPDA